MTVAFEPLPFEPQEVAELRARLDAAVAPLWDFREHKPGDPVGPDRPETKRQHVLDMTFGGPFAPAGLRFVVTRDLGRQMFGHVYHLLHISCSLQGPKEELEKYLFPIPLLLYSAQHCIELISGRRLCRPVGANLAGSQPHFFYDPCDLGIPDPPEVRG